MASAMQVRQLCGNCEEVTASRAVTVNEEFKVRGETIRVPVTYFECAKCADRVLDPDSVQDPFKAAYAEYRRRKGLLTPEEIANWRKKTGLSQAEVAELLGIGTASLSRYENGSLQDDAHDKLLRMAMSPAGFAKLVKDNQTFTAERKEQMLKAVSGGETTCALENTYTELAGRQPVDAFSGFKSVDFGKLSNAVRYFCLTEEGVIKTKLNKLLFYADFKYFKESATSITGLRYAHGTWGPIPDNYAILIAALQQRGEISVEEVEYPRYAGEKLVNLRPPDLNVFSPGELEVLVEVAKHFRPWTASKISEFSHQEAAYKNTEPGQILSYAHARELGF
jgi:putative zinc finger/helix-turn-helix YgiT family protein